MAQREYAIDLQNTEFPMLSEQKARTTIGATAGEAPARSNKPGLAYCHNVMPSNYGIDSVGYLSVIPALATLPAGLNFSDIRIIYGNARSRIYLAWDQDGNAYALVDGSTAWIALPVTVPDYRGIGFSIDKLTAGEVNGVSYIFYSGIGCFWYSETLSILEPVTLTGLTILDVIGVVASSGYLIAYTKEAVAWSSTILPTDFVPSQVTGAGGGNVAGIAGDILFAVANSLGIIVYTDANAVAATYTGNARFPFKFREINNSKGGINLDRIAYEANSGSQFVYSKAGLQTVTSNKAENILPEVTDFLAGKRFEDYNETTELYEITELATDDTMLKKIKYIASRYLVISYGLPSVGFTHAIVFDTALNKLGKLKIAHTDVFEYVGAQTEISKESIAFLLPTGEVKVLNFSSDAVSTGVAILGKLQFVRTRFINLLGIEVENIQTGAALSVSTQASLSGKGYTSVAGTLASSEENLRDYNFRSQAKNHSLVFIGQFNLTTVQVKYSTAGRR